MLETLLSTAFIPHGHCYFWNQGLLWLHVVSDILTTIGYYLMAGAVVYFTQGRKDLPAKTVVLLIGTFLVFSVCGTTHLLNGVTTWYPVYWLEGVVKAVNAGISLYVFTFMLVPLIPVALDAPSHSQLEAANFALNQEISERKKIEHQLEISLAALQAKNQELRDNESRLTHSLKELTRTREELVQSEKMASLGRLVAGFAHELNTPLGVAVGSASALQHEAQKVQRLMSQEEVDVDELLSAVSTIEQGFKLTLSNLERAANLVTSFKRTAVDQTSGEMRAFGVREVIDDTINTLHNRFKQTEIEITVTCPEDLKIKSQPGALEQILTNLLMNSLIHGFEEGKRAGQIQVIVHCQENQLHLKYLDDGKGIKPEHQAKIFEPFFTTHRTHGGSGLGMYICYNLVTTQLQGTIDCESEPGKGVKFIIDFPVGSFARTASPKPSPQF